MKSRPYSVSHRSYTNRVSNEQSQTKQSKKQIKSFRARTYDRSFNEKSAVKISHPHHKIMTKNHPTEGDYALKDSMSKIKPIFKSRRHGLDKGLSDLPDNSQIKLFQRNRQPIFHQKRSQDSIISRPRIYHMYNRKFKAPEEQCIDPSQEQQKYTKQLNCFAELANILEDIKISLQQYSGGNARNRVKNQHQQRFIIQPKISAYRNYVGIVTNVKRRKLAFIDEILSQYKNKKMAKIIRTCRINEILSVCYLFLEIAEYRLKDNQSELINFIGFCCNNIQLLTRVYLLLKRKDNYRAHELQEQVQEFEIKSFGHVLTNFQHVLLRIQHNNQIIAMIHKKLGKNNTKFEQYIKKFMFQSDRNNNSTGLCSHYIFQYLAMYIHEESHKLLGVSKTLEIAPAPYIAPAVKEYTLVVEPFGVIKDIHDSSDALLRPYVMQFFKWAYKHFDIILWTWQMPAQTQSIQELLEPYLFSKLYRYHCAYNNSIYVKDLRRLGRNLEKTVIIDYDQRIFAPTPSNGFVTRWKNQENDKGLLLICEVLEQMINNSSSVGDTIHCYTEELRSIRI